MNEQWRRVPTHPNYEVSDQGRIRSWSRMSKGALLKIDYDHLGYGRVHLYDGHGNRLTTTVHRIVLMAFVGPRPGDRPHIRHLDGNPRDNSLSNLAYGTVSENARDTVKHGRNKQATKTHCLRGHEFTPENTYTSPSSTQRWCRECRSKDSRDRYQARKQVAA